MALSKTRLDDYLVQAGFALDKKEAQALIMSGEVRLKGNPAKASDLVRDVTDVQWRAKPPYVSRGGEKLRGALDHFRLSVRDAICLDIGSSTGGFTECLLQAGSREVYAIDVGEGLLDAALRADPRVRVMEGVNFRQMDVTPLKRVTFGLVVIDVSFIGLEQILPNVALAAPNTPVLALIKPQFEGTPKEVPGGFVKDDPTRQAILAHVQEQIQKLGFAVQGLCDSPIKGRKGNQETFALLKYQVL